MDSEPAKTAAPAWSVFLLLAYVAHFCEEYWGGPGLPAWVGATLDAELSQSRFVAINAVALPLFTAAAVGAVRSHGLAWLAAAIAALFFLNGVLHLLATVAFASYSPGTVTGAVLYLPIGGRVLWSMSRTLPAGALGRAVLTGIAVHALATFAAFV